MNKKSSKHHKTMPPPSLVCPSNPCQYPCEKIVIFTIKNIFCTFWVKTIYFSASLHHWKRFRMAWVFDPTVHLVHFSKLYLPLLFFYFFKNQFKRIFFCKSCTKSRVDFLHSRIISFFRLFWPKISFFKKITKSHYILCNHIHFFTILDFAILYPHSTTGKSKKIRSRIRPSPIRDRIKYIKFV